MRYKPDLMAQVHGFTSPTLLGGLLLLSTVPTSCVDAAWAPEYGSLPGEFSPHGGHPFGLDGSVTQEEALTVEYLAWPQDREAMITLIGFPLHFSGQFDYYQAPGGRWLVIRYNGPLAVGYHYEERR
ncbi:hypothetical protein [Leptolyngbya sp. KIOST-1]|uniref:hypothetical protein n=1 Tax=Leptolyngbya sp. KIOST-1 TaxID=1229172 RepID=UPI000559D708|nr:hypothetical protein [Leptolyngbya sp. KIOST-1]